MKEKIVTKIYCFEGNWQLDYGENQEELKMFGELEEANKYYEDAVRKIKEENNYYDDLEICDDNEDAEHKYYEAHDDNGYCCSASLNCHEIEFENKFVDIFNCDIL